jgi:hypothetical protein
MAAMRGTRTDGHVWDQPTIQTGQVQGLAPATAGSVRAPACKHKPMRLMLHSYGAGPNGALSALGMSYWPFLQQAHDETSNLAGGRLQTQRPFMSDYWRNVPPHITD